MVCADASQDGLIMGARQKLNQAHLAGAGIASLFVGGLTGSLLIGGVVFALLMCAGVANEDIRLEPRKPRGRR